MLDARNSVIKRRSDLDLKKKFNQVFDDLIGKEKVQKKESDRVEDLLESLENKIKPTFKLLSRENSPSNESERSQNNRTSISQRKQNFPLQIKDFMAELPKQAEKDSNSQHELTYIDKLNDSDQVIMPYSQENINSIKSIEDVKDYLESEVEIIAGSEKIIGVEDIVQFRGQKSGEMERKLKLEQVRTFENKKEMLTQENEEISSNFEEKIQMIEKSMSQKVKNSAKKYDQQPQESISISITSNHDKGDQQNCMTDSFEGLRMLENGVNQLEQQEHSLRNSLKNHQNEKEQFISSEEFFSDIREVHLGVEKPASQCFILSKETIEHQCEQKKKMVSSKNNLQGQFAMKQHSISLSKNQSFQSYARIEQGEFQSFDEESTQYLEGSTKYFDCNLVLNNSLSFTSSQRMINKNYHDSNKQNSKEQKSKSNSSTKVLLNESPTFQNQSSISLENIFFQDNKPILEDIDEDQLEENAQNDMPPSKQSQISNRLKSHEYINFSEQDLLNLQKHQQHSISLKTQTQNNFLTKSNMTNFFIELIQQLKTHYSQFVYSIQEELFSYKQGLAEENKLMMMEMGKCLEKIKRSIQIKIREQLQKQYDEKFREGIGSVEEDFLEREDRWREEMANKLQEDIGKAYEERYQYMVARLKGQQQERNSLNDQEEGIESYFKREKIESYFNQQKIESYFKRENSQNSKILPLDMSIFGITNYLNQHEQTGDKYHSKLFSKQKPHLKPSSSHPTNDPQFQSLLNDLSLQNQSLCQELLLQQQHTYILNEQHLKYKQQIKKMNYMEDELEELKKENLQLKTYLSQLQDEKEQIRKVLEGQTEKIQQERNNQIQEVQIELRAKSQNQIFNLKHYYQTIIQDITNGNNPAQKDSFGISLQKNSQLLFMNHFSQIKISQNLQPYNIQLAQFSEQLTKQFKQKLSEQLNRKNDYIFTLEDEMNLILEKNKEIEKMNLYSEEKNEKLFEQMKRLKEEIEIQKVDKQNKEKQFVLLSQEYKDVYNSKLLVSKQLQSVKSELNKKLNEIMILNEQNTKFHEDNVMLNNQIAKLSKSIQQLKSQVHHYQQIQRTNHLNSINPSSNLSHSLPIPENYQNMTTLPRSQHPSLIESSNRSSMRVSRASNKDSLLNPSLNQHSFISQNPLVNQILENIKSRRSMINFNQSSNSSVNADGFENHYNQSFWENINHGQKESGLKMIKQVSTDNYQLYLKQNPSYRTQRTQYFSSQQEIPQNSNQPLSQTNRLSLQQYHLAKSSFGQSNTTNHKDSIIPIHSPKSPSSTSILSKKVSSSQKDKKMSIISLKLEKLRSDIKEEIKEISTISK